VAADKTDQPGVLGNLPRSRPGQRSQKRVTAAKPAAAKKPTARARPAARRKAPTARKPVAARKPAPQPAASPSPDPLTFALRTAGKVAEVGLKTAGGILRRFPGR